MVPPRSSDRGERGWDVAQILAHLDLRTFKRKFEGFVPIAIQIAEQMGQVCEGAGLQMLL